MGILSVVGLGPGSRSGLTFEAADTLENSDVICGYTKYVDLVRGDYPLKEFITTGMTKEMQRCRAALQAAAGEKSVAMVCSGDSGVYGMAGLILTLADEYPTVVVNVVSGVTAATSGAAVLGAPLTHDFCVISLSDALTTWETIERRLRAASAGDFSVCLYNPMSKSRPEHLRAAVDILLEDRDPETSCGWVENISRDCQEKAVCTLAELRSAQLNMSTTVYVGNSTTKIMGEHLVTPRGYIKKYGK